MKKVLVIAGPTAAGKTGFSITMAEKLKAEVISGDSIQVYRGLDIGSGKVTKEEMGDIPHHLIDILSPKDSYSSADFQRMARKIIDESDTPMIICGGTGLYLKACLYDYSFNKEEEGPSTDPALEQYTNEELYAMLEKIDPVQIQKIHVNNRKRLMRSLTIAQRSGKPQSEIEKEQSHEMIYDAFIAGCTMDREKLYAKINRRVEMMFENGLKNEIETLLNQGVTFSDASMQGIGYKEWESYFRGNITEEEVKEEIQKHSRQFAKRQYTWFRHQMPVHWFDISEKEDTERMINEIMAWYQR
ncbi:MAG TPA: tRNA (adenosine(37)-N6)-dimethylallyltransferase MiaA [Erysipelotrichaceae bacterium]|nr:tRNA (adenosine(37)-N6)-dimethylallyltransferase MiaA [Erysipelotrichaceae bacterium]